MNAARSPIARKLFLEWQRVRGAFSESDARPFSRRWEELLEDGGLTSSIERSDAERDARELATNGWVELKAVRYKPHQVERIVIPLIAEARWCEAFGFVPPSDEDARLIREFPWEPAMAFVREARLSLSFIELRRINDFIKAGNRDCDIVPIKERSLELFGDEKRLDELLGSALFREGRLCERRDLRCEIIGVPLARKRGPAAASAQPIIVLENAATWHSYSRWNAERGMFSAVVYGDGNRFVDGVRYLADIFAELGGPRRVYYFGDLDPQGLRIPQLASKIAQSLGLSRIEPHLPSYRRLLEIASGQGQNHAGDESEFNLCDWLEDCAEPARQLFARQQRLPQEHLGWDELKHFPTGRD